MENAFQQARSAFGAFRQNPIGELGKQLGAAARIAVSPVFPVVKQENILPKPGFVFGKNAQGQPDPNYQISRELMGGIKPSVKAAQVPSPVVEPVASPAPRSLAPTRVSAAELKYGRNPQIGVPGGYSPSDEVIGAISKASSKYGIPQDFLFDLFAQESSLDPTTTNTTPEGLAAGNPTGLAQFTDSTWTDVMRYANDPNSSLYGVLPNTQRTDPYTNALAAAYLIKMGQLGKWDASEDVWGQWWTPQELEDMGFYKQSKYHIPGVRPSERLKGKSKR